MKKLQLFLIFIVMLCCAACCTQRNIDVLILTGHTNKPHNCEVMIDTLTKILGEHKLFNTKIVTIDEKTPFSYKFTDEDVVVLNFNEVEWDGATKKSFNDYVYNGGGVIVVHEADNAFSKWREYNRIIGLGGWYGRDVNSGPYLYYKDGKAVRDPQPGICGSHGKTAPFKIENRNPEHPIMKGLPDNWMHYGDQLTSNLRGPAEEVEILATAYSDPGNKGSGKDEPMIFTVGYGKGRIVQTVLGHTSKGNGEAVGNRGFQITFLRSVEWVATGDVVELKDLTFKDDNKKETRMNKQSANFLLENELKWENPDKGITRQILGYDDKLMLVRINFEKGAIGTLHSHPHSQSSYVVSGEFEVEINGQKRVLKAGDGFYVEPDAKHGVVCLVAGTLIDTFSPIRADFL